MNEEQFTELALKVLSAEATPDEQARLDRAVGEDPALALEFETLREAFAAARAAAPFRDARNPEAVPFPEYRLRELQSSVRTAFPRQEEERKESRLSLARFLFSPWGGVAFALLAVSLIVLRSDLGPKPYVGIGLYAEETTRGEAPTPAPDVPGVLSRRFDSDAAFAAWQAGPLGRGEKARLWIDEEKDLLHVRTPSGERTEALPASPRDREARLQALTRELTGR